MRSEMLLSLAWLGILCILYLIPRATRLVGMQPPRRLFHHEGVPGARIWTNQTRGHEGMISDGIRRDCGGSSGAHHRSGGGMAGFFAYQGYQGARRTTAGPGRRREDYRSS